MAGKSNNVKIEALKEETRTEGDVDDDFLERFAEETGWKSVLLYQYLSGYIVMVAMSALTATAISWLETMHVIITPEVSEEEQAKINYFEYIIYLMDFVYFIDIIFRALYSITRWPNMKLFNEPVPIELIIIDIISVIPYDLMYKAVENRPIIVASLRLRVMLRLYRIGTSLSQLNKMFHEVSILSTILWSTALMLLCIIIPSSIHYILYCQSTQCKYRHYGAFIKAYTTASRYLMTNGADFEAYEIKNIYHMYSLLAIIYFVATMYIVADLACKNINRIKAMYCFIHDYQKTMNLYNFMKDLYQKEWGFQDEQVYFTLKDYYFHYLRQRNGISTERVLHKILPESLTKSIIMDMAFDSFRHSHIFRNLDLNIVRFLSALVRFEFAVPGQVIVRKGDFFNRMVYISHGVLQILSHEDGETPVLNLSGGTSLGETTLFLSFPLNCTIICQTYCELVVIDKTMIRRMIDYYPNEYRDLVKAIMARFEDAKRLRGVVQERMGVNLIKSDLLIMSWIKQFQRCFLHDLEGQTTSLESKIRGLQYYIDNLIFYVTYLDKLVVSEEIELVKDSVFLKSSYHFILQPQSPILLVWNIAVLLITIFFIIMYPYNLCYPKDKKSIQSVFTIFVTVIFWLDIYLQIFTAVKTRGATYLTFKSILVYRLRQKEFLIDCFAALPLEYFITFLTGHMRDIIFMFLQSNRLVKYYKIISFFNDMNIWSTNMLTAFNYIKFILHFLVYYYYATMLIYIFNCYEDVCTPEFEEMLTRLNAKSGYRKILAVSPLANALITGVIIGQMPKTENPYIYLGYTLMAVLGYLMKAVFLVNVISSSALQNYILLKQQEYLLGIAEALEWFEVTKSYRIGIHGYLNTLFYFNSDIYMHYNDMILPTELGASFRNIHLTRILGKNPFFKMISNNLVSFLSSSLKIVIIPANMVVFYCGQAIDECYIIQQGYCTMWYGNLWHDVTVNENLGLVEVLLDVPIFHTIVTRTDCVLIQISKQELQRFFSNFEKESEMVYKALSEFAKCEQLLSRKAQVFTGGAGEEELTNLFQNMDTRTQAKVTRWERIKQFVMRKRRFRCRFNTISTTSYVLLIWEIVKNSALVLSLVYTGTVASTLSRTVNFYMLLFLDFFCFADIVLRFAVTYFDSNGFEIKRFGRTSLHYLTHAFLVDLIGSFPIDFFLPNGELIFTRLNRYILTYRIFGLAYHMTKRIKKVRQYVYTAHLLVFLMLTQNLANYYVTYCCTRIGDDIVCDENSWFALSIGQYSTGFILFESLLFLLSIFVGIGFRRYNNVSLYERFALSMWGILGHLSVIIIVGRAVSYYLFRNADLTTYQDAMRDLVRFLSYCDIDKNIKYEVIQHFEYIWEKRQGKDIADVIHAFPTSIKKDLLFNIYGKYLRKNVSVFNYAEDNFLKSLLMVVKQETFRKTGVIYKVDDIHGTIFFLLKGSVEVLGPDSNRLLTLESGSLFGCLDDCKESRQTLTMVAKGHVETLSFSSEAFYKLLNQHPKFRSKFFQAANMHFDYIQSYKVITEFLNSEKKDSDVPEGRHSNIMNIMNKMSRLQTRIMKPSKHFSRLELTLFIMEFFLGSAYELVLMTINPSLAFLLMAYFRDALWIIRMYIKFHIAYEDEYGMLQYNRKKIAARYIRQKDGFYFDLFCLLPVDCLMLFIHDDVLRDTLMFVLRLNRFFRCIYLFLHMARTTKKLNINVLLMRTAYIIMYAYIYVIIKFIVYFWCETYLVKVAGMNNFELIVHSMNYLDTILFIFATSPIPYTDFFGGWAPLALCVIICLDTCFLVFFFSNFAGTLQVVTKVKSKYLRICLNLKLLMLICDASTPLIDKVTMYTNILLRIRNGIQFPFLLEQAPYYLREAVLNSMFGFHLRNHYLFKDCHTDFLRQLSATMRTLTYFQGNPICDAGDIDETMYFIQEGVVQALTKDTLYTEVCEHLLVAGESFGLNQILYPRCGQFYSYRASVLTTLVTIKRKEFVRLVTFFPSVMKHIYNRSIEFAS